MSLAREFGVSDTLIRKVRRGELWSGELGPRNRNDVPRRVIVETLILAGPRISELCSLDGPHVDIAAGRLRIPRSATKTDAGERSIPIVPALEERLREHGKAYPGGPGPPLRHATVPVSIPTTSAREYWRRSAIEPTSCLRPRVACRSGT